MKKVFIIYVFIICSISLRSQISIEGCYLSGALIQLNTVAGCGASGNYCNLAAIYVPAFTPSACGTSTVSGGVSTALSSAVILPAGCTATIVAEYMKRNAWGAPINPSGSGCSNSGMDGAPDALYINSSGGVIVSQGSTLNVNVGTCGAYPSLGTYTTAVSSLTAGCSNADGRVRMVLTGGTFTIGGNSNRSDELITYTVNLSGTCGPSCSLVLPVELMDFSAENKNDVVELVWNSASEKDLDHYLIERSQDAEKWQTLSTVYPQNQNSSVFQTYQAIDHYPIYGINYYRLSSKDKDGTGKTHKIAAVNYSLTKNTFHLSQNEDELIIHMDEKTHHTSFSIYDITGRIVKIIENMQGQTLSVSKKDLPKGLLLLECEASSQVGLTKVVVY